MFRQRVGREENLSFCFPFSCTKTAKHRFLPSLQIFSYQTHQWRSKAKNFGYESLRTLEPVTSHVFRFVQTTLTFLLK